MRNGQKPLKPNYSPYLFGVLRLLTYYLLALCLMTSVSCDQKQDRYLLRASLLVNEDHTWYKAFRHFQQILDEKSGGRIQLQVYPSEQLGKELESIRLIQAGVIDMTVTASTLSNWIEIAAFCEMPFLMRDTLEKKLLMSGEIGQEIKSQIIEKTGLRPVATFERGLRHLTSNRPIKHPDDLNGMILRVPNVPSFVTAWKAMGAKPTPMAFSEVFTSLQQGTVEGQENPFALIASAGFAEVQKYVNLTGHVMSWSYPVIGEKQFQELPVELQHIFLDAAIEMEAYEKRLFKESEENIQQQLRDKGMVFIEPDRKAFSQKCEAAIYESLSADMKVIYQRFVDLREDLNTK